MDASNTGENRLTPRICNMIREDLPRQLNNCHQLHQRGDASALAREIHQIKGTAAFCGFPGLKKACELAEKGALKDLQHPDTLAGIGEMEKQVQVVIDSLPA